MVQVGGNRIGIRLEDKNDWERRVPLVPADVADLVRAGIAVTVQPSPRRVFPDSDYLAAGAEISQSLDDCGVVLAVKEIPAELLRPATAYAFFSHTIKGQPHNMPLLATVLELGATLIDYERAVDASGRRLIHFGRFAGLAGTLDALWAYGQRLAADGIRSALLSLRQTYTYPDLPTALAAVTELGVKMQAQEALDPRIGPLVVGVTGDGNVARGAREVLDRLPTVAVDPADLTPEYLTSARRDVVHVVSFREEHTVAAISGAQFDLAEYRAHPEAFRSTFADHLGALSILVNCIGWDHRSPRLVELADVAALCDPGSGSRLGLIADLSCDIRGGIECTVRATEPGDPVYVYDPATGAATSGTSGPGIAVLAVDNLPCELPRDASESFSNALRPFVPALARADFSADFAALDLPPEVKGAVIAHRGSLTPGYEYLGQELDSAGSLAQ